MEKRLIEVMTLDSSESEDDDIQIESENIRNYGNYSSPVEITPELQKKLQESVKKYSTNPGKITAIKVFATKKHNNERGTVRASFHPTGRQASQIINFGPVFNANFVNQVQSPVNFNPENQRKPTDPLISDFWNLKRDNIKHIPQTVLNDNKLKRGKSPSTLSTPVIFSPIRKTKQIDGKRNILTKTKQKECNPQTQSSANFPKNNDADSRQNCIPSTNTSPYKNYSISSWQKTFQQFHSPNQRFLGGNTIQHDIEISLKASSNDNNEDTIRPIEVMSLDSESDSGEEYTEFWGKDSSDEEHTGNSSLELDSGGEYTDFWGKESDTVNSPFVWKAPKKVKGEPEPIEEVFPFLRPVPCGKRVEFSLLRPVPRGVRVKVPVPDLCQTQKFRRSKRKTPSELQKKEIQYIQSKLLIEDDSELGLKEDYFPEKGKGVVTTKSFKKGEFVLEYVGDIIDIASAEKREIEYSEDETIGSFMFYFKYKEKTYCLDGTLDSGRLGRLLNHSCKHPTLIAKVITVEELPRLIFVAFRDIEIGEELLFDYGERDEEAIKEFPWLLS